MSGRFALTLAVGALGGWMMWHFHMPLAWLLGAMIFSGVAAFLRVPLAMPKFARPPMTATIGAMLGTSFNPNVFDHARVWMVSIGSVLAYSPGGVAEMSLIALSLGIEVPFVVFHHIVRVLIVVAGSAAVFRLRFDLFK